MICLVNWSDEWFVAVISHVTDPKYTCKLQAPNDPRFEATGFERRGKLDKHYYKSFERDPGFKYFAKLKYKGYSVGLHSIHPDAMPREVHVGADLPDPPPPEIEIEKWKYRPRDGYERYIRIDELEMTEIPPPDWSQIK